MTDWNTWARILDAAQDPQYRDAVQQFLAQVELSAEFPAALDKKLLAPRRSAGATGEQCAYLLCNLGFAALIGGTRDAADFAAGCGRQAKQLAPDSQDLAHRCHFLFAKSALMIAALTGEPQVLWDDAADTCTAYLSAISEHLESLPAEAVESNAMAAYSFAAQLLTRVERNRAVGQFADAVSQLVDKALTLADRLPAPFVSRMWASVIPGTAADVSFRRIGALAECALQRAGGSSDHACRGIAYADEVIAQSRAGTDLGPIMRIRADLLLLSGRSDQAMEQAESLEKLSDGASQALASLIKARHLLAQGEPDSAAALLTKIAPTAGQALEHWQETWLGGTGGSNWTSRTGDLPLIEIDQEIWRLQAVAAADLNDMQEFLRVTDLSTGFLADAMLENRSGWTDGTATLGGEATVERMTLLDEVFEGLADGAALLQVVSTGAGFLTWVARKQDGVIRQEIAPVRPDAHKLNAAHASWSRASFDYRQHGDAAAGNKVECAGAFSGMMEEVQRNWGTLLGELADDGIVQLVLIGDDLVDIPLHATRIAPGGDRLIDRMPVSFAPSLSALRDCVSRKSMEADGRRGLELHCLAETASTSVEALAAVLQTDPVLMTGINAPSAWEPTAAAKVLHVEAGLTHNARMPLQSVLGAGTLDLPLARLAAELRLPRCELVSSFATASVHSSMLRAPGFDLATVFLASGARSVLASTWQADDEFAAEITQSFFRQWVTGLTPSVAFREALREMRSDRPSLEDFEWACMRVVGAP